MHIVVVVVGELNGVPLMVGEGIQVVQQAARDGSVESDGVRWTGAPLSLY